MPRLPLRLGPHLLIPNVPMARLQQTRRPPLLPPVHAFKPPASSTAEAGGPSSSSSSDIRKHRRRRNSDEVSAKTPHKLAHAPPPTLAPPPHRRKRRACAGRSPVTSHLANIDPKGVFFASPSAAQSKTTPKPKLTRAKRLPPPPGALLPLPTSSAPPSSDKKKGLTILTYNVAGFKSLTSPAKVKSYFNDLRRHQPDLLLIQEHNRFPHSPFDMKPYRAMGLHHAYWDYSGIHNYWGCVTFTKKQPKSVVLGSEAAKDFPGRLVALEYDEFYIINTYLPYAGHRLTGCKRMPNKLSYLKSLTTLLREFDARKPVIWGGDMNVRLDSICPRPLIPKDISTGNYSNEEITAFHNVLSSPVPSKTFVDAYIHCHPLPAGEDGEAGAGRSAAEKDQSRHTRKDGFDGKNSLPGQGSRLDTFIVSERLLGQVESIEIDQKASKRSSDHYPVVLKLKPHGHASDC